MLFTRASLSSAKCVQLVQMLEERRRVFWGTFTYDSHASIWTGWPCLIDPSDVSYALSCATSTLSQGQEDTSPFTDVVFEGAV
ncbi:fungal specific transcription factor [Hirsutella rhossiliensis]